MSSNSSKEISKNDLENILAVSGGESNNSISPRVSKKQISPSKKWCWTFNNYPDDIYSSIVPILDKYCSIAFYAKEVGESGTPHLQGYLEFKTKRRPISIFDPEIFKIHWTKAKGSVQANADYCGKDGDFN